MKKILLSILLLVSLIFNVFALAACNGGGDADDDGAKGNPPAQYPNDSSALFTLIQTQFLHERGFANFTDYAASRRRACGTDEMALIFVMERQFRAFAQHTEELEYCVLTQDNDAHAIAHELLHLFGAVDLYYPYQIYGLTMKYFPQSVMCTHEGMEVDPLNQYLIGWKTELPYKAREFMEKLTDFTVARYGEANNLEYHRNREDELLQRAVPYPSLQSVRKRVEVCDPWAEYLLGLCYRDGIGVERNLATAEEYFSRSGRTGLIIAAVAQAYPGQRETRGSQAKEGGTVVSEQHSMKTPAKYWAQNPE